MSDIAVADIVKSRTAFLNVVRKGDILISNSGSFGGYVNSFGGHVGSFIGFGHAAMMATDEFVLEMPGGKYQLSMLSNNNRLISKQKWYDDQNSYWITVYRCPDADAANSAANWAYRNYYNSTGGATKTIKITYQISSDVWSTNPSYCSKLVLQAYHFGTGTKYVIKDMLMGINRFIHPNRIPFYFTNDYALKKIGFY